MSSGLVGFIGAIWQTLGDAHYSPLLQGRVYVFDSRYKLHIPDREQIETFMGAIVITGVFEISESYQYAERLEAKLSGAGINSRVVKTEPPAPFADKF